MLSKKLAEAINEQVTAEMWSSNLYLSMSIYFVKEGFDGFSHWMKQQSVEELGHAHRMIDYVVSRGGNITLGQINIVPCGWGSPVEVFEHVYKHEQHVSVLIDNLVDIASAERDKATQDFLWGFVREQVEEESTAKNIVDKLKAMGNESLIFLDDKLGQRG